MSFNAHKLIETLTESTKLLDAYLAEQAQLAAERQKQKYDAASSREAAQSLNKDAAVRLAVIKALGKFEVSRKNAETALAKSEEQAKKDLTAISQGASSAAQAEVKLRAMCKELNDSLDAVRQKAKFPAIDIANIGRTLNSDTKLPRDTAAKLSAVLRTEGKVIAERLETLHSNVTSLINTVSDLT